MNIKFNINDRVFFVDTYDVLKHTRSSELVYIGKVVSFTVNKKGIRYKIDIGGNSIAVKEENLCCTTTEVRNLVTERLKEAISEKQKAIEKNLDIFISELVNTKKSK